MKLNTKLLTITALFIAALMLLSPISQINTSGGGGTNNYDLDFLNSLDINNNNFVLSADSLSNSVDINNVEVVDNGTKLQDTSNGEEVDRTTTFISISDVAGLKKLSDLVNDDDESNKDDTNEYGFDFSGYTIKLTKNLILDDPAQEGQSNFTPIGNDEGKVGILDEYRYKFNGTFDGQGHTISNLKIDRSGEGDKYAGLFGVLGEKLATGEKPIVKNLGIINSEISATSNSDYFAISGGIAGYNYGAIENCYNTGTVNGYDYSGGIAGRNYGPITNCYNTGTVTGSSSSGGIAGASYGPITNCYNTGTVTGSCSGGIAGYSSMRGDFVGKITNCYNTGDVTGSTSSGGIAGKNEDVTITNCYNTGTVTATATVTPNDDVSTNNKAYSGGIAGLNEGGTIENCYNTGDVTGTATADSTLDDFKNNDAYSGGIVGRNDAGDEHRGTIENCYNTGDVTGTATADSISTNNDAYSGGVVGENEGTITNCYNTGDVTGTATADSTSTSTNSSAYSGGIAGSNYGGTIENCYNTGDVTGTATADSTSTSTSTNSSAYSGGIAGLNEGGTIKNCYNSGVVTGTAISTNSSAYSGGIVGKNNVGSTVQSCYSKQNGNQKLIGEGISGTCKSFDVDGILSDGSKLLEALNEWVTKANERNPDDYRYWMDPFIQNEEYPVFTDWYGEAKRLNISLEKNSNGIYEIKNKHQLALIADDLNGNYVLADDINLSGYEWRPIGKDDSNQFKGTFDGLGHTISNLSVKITSDSVKVYAGLFGYLNSNAAVKNLGIIDSVINTTYDGDDRAFSGGIAGYNTGTVMNCYYTGTVIGTGAVTFGGIVGENKNGTVSNCHNTGTVIGTGTSGGIVGYNEGTITNCYNTGVMIADTAIGDAYSGGIVGNNGGPITNCYNTGVVIATATATATDGEAFSGGITGNNNGETITNCYNTGFVAADSANDLVFSGGIAGYNSGTITNCYNTGVVISDTTNRNAFSGGIAGRNHKGKIENCYNTGIVAATTNYIAFSGGIAGDNQGKIENCYNTGIVADSTNNNAYSGGIAGYNSGTITNCYNTGIVADSTNNNAYSGGIVGWDSGGTITNCYYLNTCVLNGTNNEGTELASDEMNELKLLGGKGSNNNLNKDKDGNEITNSTKPWSPDIFGVNDGYPILADVPTQIDPKDSANKPPQSAVYITLDDSKNVSKPTQAENYLKPFMLTGGKTVNAVVNCLNNQTENISYQWYEMKNDGTLEEVKSNGGSSEFDLVHGTYCVKVTIGDYSYTSLTRTASNIVTVTFINDVSDVNEIETYYNETISQPEGPTKTGYAVEGWYYDSSFIKIYDFNTPVTENTILYAKWKLIDYSVEYNGNNNTSGTVPIDNEKYTIGNTINIELNEGNLAKSGHIFRGWNYTPNASSALSSSIILDENVIKYHIGEDNILNLYAVWTPIPEPIYTLCLNSNDSTLQTKRYSGTYGTEITLKSASDFGWNDECKFIEWNSKSDGSGVSYKEGDKFSLGSEVWNLYAIWSDSSYHTVSFDSNGGNSIPSQSVQDGYRASEPNAPTKQGHSFKHWSLNGTKYDFNQSVKEDITLKAEYELISYKVTFYYNGDVYYSTVADYNTSLGDRMPSLPSDKDSWNTSENGKGSNFTSDSLITSDISIYAVSENSILSILIIGGSAAAILAAIAAWMFMRSRYN